MKRPRFSLRWMMVIVAIAAVVVGTVASLQRRAERFRKLAVVHASKAQAAANIGWGIQRFGINLDSTIPPENAKQAAHYWNIYSHHKALREKYARAAARPWLSVKPDPPDPF